MSTHQDTPPHASVQLSVVVIGRNEGSRLERCLASVYAMKAIAPLEVIYVDSGSSDNSREMAARLGARVLPLSDGAMTAARARNAGWRAATGNVILFLDGDVVLHPQFAERALQALFADPHRAAVWGDRREADPCQSVYVRVMDLDWIYPYGDSPFFGGDVVIRRESLQAVQGYDESLIAGEEPEMCRRMRALGWRIEHIDAPMTAHDLAITHFAGYWRRARRTGYAFAQVADRFRSTSDPFWSAKVSRNMVRGSFWLLSPIAAIVLSVLVRSPWPFAVWLLLLLVMSLRTVASQRWKSHHWPTLLLHGFHSHLQQVPIMVGQVQYFLDRRHSRARTLIEYKDRA